MMRLALIPAALMLLYPQPKTALADVVITDPVVGATTAEIDGVAVDVGSNLTLHFSAVSLPGEMVNLVVYPSIGINGHGPVWAQHTIPEAEYCGWGGCPVGTLGNSTTGGPLDDPSFGLLDLTPYIGHTLIATQTADAKVVRILTPPPVLMPAETLGDLFAYLQAWFAGAVSETPTEYVARWFDR